MIIIKNAGILEKYTMYQITLGTPLRCSSTIAPALSYYRPSMDICIALLPAIRGSICSFWKNISGHFERFTCIHSLCTGSTVLGQCMERLPNGYALITGILPCTLRARFAHVKSFLRFYRRIEQTTAMDGGSVDFASLHGCNLLGQCRSYCRGASHRPDSLPNLKKTSPQLLHSYEISGLASGD